MHLGGPDDEVEDEQPLCLRAISQCKPLCHQLQEWVPLSRTETTPDMEIHKKNDMGPVGAVVVADKDAVG